MPCNTRQRTTVELSGANIELLVAGLEAIGFTVRQKTNAAGELQGVSFSRGGESGRFENGRLTIEASRGFNTPGLVNEIKRAHSVANVQATVARFGWQLKQSSDFEFDALKRSL